MLHCRYPKPIDDFYVQPGETAVVVGDDVRIEGNVGEGKMAAAKVSPPLLRIKKCIHVCSLRCDYQGIDGAGEQVHLLASPFPAATVQLVRCKRLLHGHIGWKELFEIHILSQMH